VRGSIIIAIVLVLGCSKKQPVRTTPPPVAAATPAPVPTPPPAPASPHVAVTDDLARTCKLQLANVERAPRFGYDEAELLPSDRDVLQQVASCVTSGPLKGRRLQLVGRADPRGTDEYNLGLGTRRAHTVGDYLRRLGVAPDQLAATTRGEIDATGRDETSWSDDRRVDLMLLN
jgi:peptidoglycan-associated lipoprotein